jgi:N-acetylglucosamine kinase-like BadF-type ATPase
MIRVLGVDGGQSAIRLRHSLSDHEAASEGVGHQEGDTIGMVAEAVAKGWERLGSPAVDRVVLGLTTAPLDTSRSDRLCGLVSEATAAPEVWLADDAVTSHVGALSGHPGVCLVAGTGVACLALPADGTPRIVGGHGYLLGDEGGGFWIGRRGLGAVLRAGDRLGPATVLKERAEARFGRLDDLHVRLHEGDRPVDSIARFAPDVVEAAGDDVVASGIVDEAARELLLLAAAGASWASIGGGPVPVAVGGRLLASGTVLRRRLDTLLRVSEVPMEPRDPDASPLEGAIALGRSTDPGRYTPLVHVWRVRAPA